MEGVSRAWEELQAFETLSQEGQTWSRANTQALPVHSGCMLLQAAFFSMVLALAAPGRSV